MSIDYSLTLTWVERCLSLVGVVALGTWILHWLTQFVSKQRELTQIDKEIRAALREAWTHEKRERIAGQSRFEHQMSLMRKEIDTATIQLESQQKQLTYLEKKDAVLRLGSRLSNRIAEADGNDAVSQIQTAFEAVLRAVCRSRSATRELTPASSTSANTAAVESSQPRHEVFGPLLDLLVLACKLVGQFEAKLESSSSVVPSLIRDLDEHPELTVQDLFNRVFERMESRRNEVVRQLLEESERR